MMGVWGEMTLLLVIDEWRLACKHPEVIEPFADAGGDIEN